MEQDFFDIEKLHKNFTAALKDDTDVMMDLYLEGYKELSKCESNNSICKYCTVTQLIVLKNFFVVVCFSKDFSN